MDSWLVFRRNRVILNQWTKRNDWSFKRFSKTPFVWSFPMRQEILNVSQKGITFHGICPPFFHPDLIATILQTYLLSLCVLLSQQSHLFQICVVSTFKWFQERSSQALPNSKELSVWMTLGFLFGSKNFCKLLCVSWEVFVLHGYDWIHWVAKSCTKTAYRWLFRDSQPSLRTLWSAVIKSPKFPARGTAPPMRLLHGELVILVLWQISQFRSLGKWV